MTVYKLIEPVTVDGKTYQELTVRRLKVREAIAMGALAAEADGNDAALMKHLIPMVATPWGVPGGGDRGARHGRFRGTVECHPGAQEQPFGTAPKARPHTGHGPANMAVLRHFAFNLLRSLDDKRSLKLRRKRAAWNPQYLLQILQSAPR